MSHDTFSIRVDNLVKVYPGVKALDGVSIDFRPGEVHALIGENGAGKSTLIKCIAGAISPTEGTITVNGTAYKTLSPQMAKELGISVIYQEFNQVASLSAAENVFLCEKTGKGFLVNIRDREKKAAELFQQIGVEIDPSRPVRELSPACQQIIEIAKAMSKNVKFLIMDEPTAPLTVSEVRMLFRIVEGLKKKGITILYISHRLEEIFEIADRVTVMRDGQYIKTLNVAEADRATLITLMAGHSLNESYPQRNISIGEEMLRVEDLSGNGVQHINFSLHKGEVLGFAGLVGAGRTELMQVIYGAAPRSGGEIYVKGKRVRNRTPREGIANGIGMIPEDRKANGVFLNQSIQWNTVINAIRKISKYGVVNTKAEKEIAQNYKERFHIKTPSLQQLVSNLSGGNQQKVVLAKTMAAETSILIFDEPTRGIDVGAKQEIYKFINELALSGHAIIIVSSDMPELLGMSDRIAVISEGRMTGILEKSEFDQNRILDLASQ